MAIISRTRPAPDSHFRLIPCKCGGEAEYLQFDTGLWAVRCTSRQIAQAVGIAAATVRNYRQRYWNHGLIGPGIPAEGGHV